MTTTFTLNAQYNERECTLSIKNMTYNYRMAEILYNQKDYKKSIEKFQLSLKNANLGVLSCEGEANYDFNLMYNYIVESENRIYQIREELLD